MPDDIQLRVACRAIIVRDGKVLLIRESGKYEEGTNVGKYDMPGGRIVPGQPLVDELKREAVEECGLQVEVGRPVYVTEWYPVIKGVPHHIVGIYFECTSESGDVVLSQDHDEFVWADPKDLGGFTLMSGIGDALAAYAALVGR